MTVWTTSLLIGALLTVAVNYNSPRVAMWVCFAAANFTITYLYFSVAPWWLPHAALTGFADILLALAINTYRVNRWELWVQRCYMFSVLVSVAFLFDAIPSQAAYAEALEGCNWIALLVMGGHGMLSIVDERDVGAMVGGRPLGRRVHRARTFLDEEARSPGIIARSATRR